VTIVLADTSAWSRFYRNDTPPDDPIASALDDELRSGSVVTTGLIYLELLRGFTRSNTRTTLAEHFEHVPCIEPARDDHAAAADVSLICRRAGVQVATVDALIAQICLANDLTLLTSDADFTHIARQVPLKLWRTG